MTLTPKQKTLVQNERETIYRAYLLGFCAGPLEQQKCDLLCAFALGQTDRPSLKLRIIQEVLDQVAAFLGR